jgi:hypothetical protein
MGIINWNDVTLRYKVLGDYDSTSAQQVEYIAFAEAELNRRLSACYAVPFSSNNITARDLVVDIAFANTIKFRDNEKYETVMEHIDKVAERLCANDASMINDDGTLITPTGTADSGKAYSSTKDFHPIFDMGDTINQKVSDQQLIDENDAKD